MNSSDDQPVEPLPVEVVHAPDLDPARREYYETENRDRSSISRRLKPWVEVIGVAVACLLAWLTYSTLQEIKKQTPAISRSAEAAQGAAKTARDALDSARDNFRQDERPYIWLTNTGLGQPEFIPNPNTNPTTGQIVWSYHYTNYGKAPAYDLFASRAMKVGINGIFQESYGFSRATVPGRKGPPVPPNKDDFNTVVSHPGVTNQEYKRLFGIDAGISIRMRFQYTDAYGGMYETSICLEHLASNAIRYCEGSNIK